jgi:ketosteroid isomerase-like protein
MYHAIIRRLVRQNFELVNNHEWDRLLASCRPDILHRFGGDHALGGQRHDREHLRLWFERLGRLTPDLRLTVLDVWVKGFPHNTTAIVRWTSTAPRTDAGYRNHGVHVIAVRWGKVAAIDANEDSQAVERLLRDLAEKGATEAAAEPIMS